MRIPKLAVIALLLQATGSSAQQGDQFNFVAPSIPLGSDKMYPQQIPLQSGTVPMESVPVESFSAYDISPGSYSVPNMAAPSTNKQGAYLLPGMSDPKNWDGLPQSPSPPAASSSP